MDTHGTLDRPHGPKDKGGGPRKLLGFAAALAVLAGIATVVYLDSREPPEPIAPPLDPANEARPAPQPIAQPPTQATEPSPSPETQARAEPAVPLPPFDKSDEFLQNLLSYMVGPTAFAKLLNTNDLVRRFVVTVDNLPRQQLPQRLLPLKPADGPFLTGADGSGFAVASANFERYRPYVRAAEAIDTKQLVAGYVRFYPWFQQEYQSQGYPSGVFHERLLAAIDVLLSTPEVAGPLRVRQPKVLYEFADPDLEALPAGQKTLLRMGPDNAARIKAKLREIRRELVASPIGRPGR